MRIAWTFGCIAAMALVLGCSAEGTSDACKGAACEEAPPVSEPAPADEPAFEAMPAAATFNLPDLSMFDPATTPVVDPVEDPDPVVTPVGDELLPEDLTAQEVARIDSLRTAINDGLDVGRVHYLETVSLVLQTYGVLDDYESIIDAEGPATAEEEPESCPFMQYYGNLAEPNPVTCEYLVDLAKVETYASLTKTLDGNPMIAEIAAEHAEEAEFWREQGAISGIEERRVVTRSDLSFRDICNTSPTALQSASTKGAAVGRQLFTERFNVWLAGAGYVPDYPTMSSKIQVCNANVTMLEPALKDAQTKVAEKSEADPLCEGYDPPTQQAAAEFGQAEIDYQISMEAGVQDEFALAAVSVFTIIPCNVSDPLVVDLDGDGIELLPIHRGTDFDLWDLGRKQAMAWPSADDGFLVLDLNQNGVIDNGSELFGNTSRDKADGFADLARLDTAAFGGNSDGRLTSDDAYFARLQVWQDADTDGDTDAGELRSMAAVGITSIALSAVESSLESGGNRVPLTSQAATTSGTLLIGDAMLHTAPWPRLQRAE